MPTMPREALAAMVRLHQAELFRYLRYLGARRADAADLVQETFLAVARGSSPPDPTDRRGVAAWLRGVARHLFLSHCRQRKSAPAPLDPAALDQAEAVWREEFLRDGDGFDYVEALRRCLEGLADRERQALQLRYAERASRAAMAQRLEMTENGVKSLLRRLRARLGDCVRRRLRLEEA